MFWRYLKNIIQLIISPARGWEDVSADGESPEELCRGGFYPLLAALGVSSLLRYLYDVHNQSFIDILQLAIVIITSYFATLFFAQYAFTAFLNKFTDQEPSRHKSDSVVIYSLSVMMLFAIITNICPIEFEILKFLPVYALFVLWKASRFLDVREDAAGPYMFFVSAVVVAPPFLLTLLFNLIMPRV